MNLAEIAIPIEFLAGTPTLHRIPTTMPIPSTHKHFDCHMHTPLCGHATGDPEEYIDAAVDRRISLITFTCHIPMQGERFAQRGIRMSHDELSRYRQIISTARKYGEAVGVEVLYGIEAEVHPDEEAMAEMDKLLASEPFDFVLGSLHHMLPAFREWLYEHEYETDAEKVAAYFQCLGEGARSGRYHSLSHPDVIRVYGSLVDRFEPMEHEAAISSFLDTVAESGVCLEINTSGLIKGDFVVHPDPVIMKWALERDIPFTIGSDSHNPRMVGQFFGEVLAEFSAMGLDKLHYFKQGQRVAVDL
jgi:histidinol-phosphatase (PHP family)